MKYTEVNWKEKDIEDVYKFYERLPQHEKFAFFKWLGAQHPDKEFDWLDIFEDLRNDLAYNDNIAACEEFIQWYQKQYPDEYAQGYEFIERDLCDYYLKTGNLEKLRQRIRFISQHPVSGIDTLTIRLYFQLLYHGLYEDALNYAKAVYKPLEDDEILWGNPETVFVQGLYLNSLQNEFQIFKETGSTDFQDIFRLAADMGLKENKTILNIEQKALTNPLNPVEILKKVNSHFKDVFIELNVYFLKYMLDNYNIPFSVSEVFWNIIAVKDLFGKSRQKTDIFYIDVKTFSKTLDKRFDYSLGSNSLEMFGKIWALHYVFEFLEKNNLISTASADLMRENNRYHRNEVIYYMGNELWQMDFVFSWPQNQVWSELKPLFESTYGKSLEEARKILNEFKDNNLPVQRIQDEIGISHSKKDQSLFSLDNNLPYQKTTPDIGRNEPCPCGSGKKYKKCCLNG